MTIKQLPGLTSADGSQYVTLTDGVGNLISISSSPGGATTNIQYNLSGVLTGDSGFTYAGSGGSVTLTGATSIGTFNIIGTDNSGTNTINLISLDGSGGQHTGSIKSTYGSGGFIFQLPRTVATHGYRFNNNGGTSLFFIDSVAGDTSVKSTTTSSSTTTGALMVAGGTGIVGSLNVGGNFSTTGFLEDVGYDYQTPTTGTTVTLSNTKWHTIIDPAGTLLALTVQMPAAPTDGMVVDFKVSTAITTLTISPNSGQTVKGGPAAGASIAGVTYNAIYKSSNTTWYF